MNRQKRHLVVLVVAVATATIASVGVYRAVDRMPVREVPLAHQSVVVAARALPMGTQLTERDVKVVAWPASSPLAGAYGAVADVVNRPLVVAVLENEPLVPTKLASREAGSGLPSAIPRGMRAISVKVNDVIGVAGFIQPGSRVDLMVTMRRREDSVTRTVAGNVQVMSAGTRQEQQKQPLPDLKSTPTATTVVTLMVTPGDAERIALAQSEGQIMLVLRNPLDGETATTTGVQTAALLGQPESTPAPVKTSAPRRPAVKEVLSETPAAVQLERRIESIKAAKRTEEVIR
jgi:pilus assembly protein CpaB